MKKHLFTISLFIILAVASSAQTNVYHPFPESNTMWVVNWEVDDGFPPDMGTDIYQINGDIIFKGTKYYKLFHDGTYIGAIRNDIPNKKVYFIDYNTNYNNDTLLYDFNLKIGDTLKKSYLIDTATFTGYVKSIDSVIIGKEYHKRFTLTLSPHFGSSYIIEGIGSGGGPLDLIMHDFEFSQNLSCVTINGKTVYPDTISSCPIVSIKPSTKPTFSLTITPNPFSTSAEITLSYNLPNADLSIHNIFGTEVLALKNITNHQKIQRTNLPNGIYFYTLTQKNKIIYTGKLMIL